MISTSVWHIGQNHLWDPPLRSKSLSSLLELISSHVAVKRWTTRNNVLHTERSPYRRGFGWGEHTRRFWWFSSDRPVTLLWCWLVNLWVLTDATWTSPQAHIRRVCRGMYVCVWCSSLSIHKDLHWRNSQNCVLMLHLVFIWAINTWAEWWNLKDMVQYMSQGGHRLRFLIMVG